MDKQQDEDKDAKASTTEQQLIKALVRDLVDVAILTQEITELGQFNYNDFDKVHLLNTMCEEILSRFTQKVSKSDTKLKYFNQILYKKDS